MPPTAWRLCADSAGICSDPSGPFYGLVIVKVHVTRNLISYFDSSVTATFCSSPPEATLLVLSIPLVVALDCARNQLVNNDDYDYAYLSTSTYVSALGK